MKRFVARALTVGMLVIASLAFLPMVIGVGVFVIGNAALTKIFRWTDGQR